MYKHPLIPVSLNSCEQEFFLHVLRNKASYRFYTNVWIFSFFSYPFPGSSAECSCTLPKPGNIPVFQVFYSCSYQTFGYIIFIKTVLIYAVHASILFNKVTLYSIEVNRRDAQKWGTLKLSAPGQISTCSNPSIHKSSNQFLTNNVLQLEKS